MEAESEKMSERERKSRRSVRTRSTILDGNSLSLSAKLEIKGMKMYIDMLRVSFLFGNPKEEEKERDK